MATNAFSFNGDLVAFSRRINLEFGTVLKVVSLDAFNGIVQKTPVDEGTAKARWTIGVNGAAQPGDHKNMESKVYSDIDHEPFSIVVIQNTLIYIRPLEFGHSQKQAPHGMVRPTIRALNAKYR